MKCLRLPYYSNRTYYLSEQEGLEEYTSVIT